MSGRYVSLGLTSWKRSDIPPRRPKIGKVFEWQNALKVIIIFLSFTWKALEWEITSSVQLFPVGCKGWIAGISSLARTTAGLRSFTPWKNRGLQRHGEEWFPFFFGASIFSWGVFLHVFLVNHHFWCHGFSMAMPFRGPPGSSKEPQMTSSPNRCDVTFPVWWLRNHVGTLPAKSTLNPTLNPKRPGFLPRFANIMVSIGNIVLMNMSKLMIFGWGISLACMNPILRHTHFWHLEDHFPIKTLMKWAMNPRIKMFLPRTSGISGQAAFYQKACALTMFDIVQPMG